MQFFIASLLQKKQKKTQINREKRNYGNIFYALELRSLYLFSLTKKNILLFIRTVNNYLMNNTIFFFPKKIRTYIKYFFISILKLLAFFLLFSFFHHLFFFFFLVWKSSSLDCFYIYFRITMSSESNTQF